MLDGIAADAPAMARYPGAISFAAGYVDGLYKWSAADWALFPNSTHVGIAVFADTDDGIVLDCEPGNCTPAQSVDWVLLRRRAGVDPTVYCNQLDPDVGWPAVRAAFRARGVPEPHYWVANYDVPASGPRIPVGAVGLQYEDAGDYDLSIVADYWPGVDPREEADMPIDDTDLSNIAARVENRPIGAIASPAAAPTTTSAGVELASLPARFAQVNAAIKALDAKVSALSAPKVDPAVFAADVKAALADPALLKVLAHALAVELHNDTPAA